MRLKAAGLAMRSVLLELNPLFLQHASPLVVLGR